MFDEEGVRSPGQASDSELHADDVPFYTIGQVASLLGVPAAQLRRIEDLELIQPDRSEGNQRRYTREEIERLRQVLELTQEGVTLPGVRRILELRHRVEELEHLLEESERRFARSSR